MDLQDTLLFTTALLAIINPVSAAVLFVTTASRFSPIIQRKMADQSTLAMGVILLVCVWVGRYLLLLLGISVPMLQAAGGLILLITGLRMVVLEEAKLTAEERVSVADTDATWKALAVVPVAIPGAVGAGTITTVVVQATTYTRWQDLLVITAVTIGTALLMWITFRSSGRIARRLGPIGLNIVTRVMGILVTATAFGLLARGVGGLLPGLMVPR